MEHKFARYVRRAFELEVGEPDTWSEATAQAEELVAKYLELCEYSDETYYPYGGTIGIPGELMDMEEQKVDSESGRISLYIYHLYSFSKLMIEKGAITCLWRR